MYHMHHDRVTNQSIFLSYPSRVVAPNMEKTIPPHTFTNWGAHFDGYPCPYFTAAAAIGMKQEEVDIFVKRLDKVFVKFRKRQTPGQTETVVLKNLEHIV